MIIHCFDCETLFETKYSEDGICPTCGSSATEHSAIDLIYQPAANDDVKGPGRGTREEDALIADTD